MNKNTNFVKFITASILFLFAITMSEVFYTLRNNDNKALGLYLFATNIFARSNNTKIRQMFLDAASNVHVHAASKRFSVGVMPVKTFGLLDKVDKVTSNEISDLTTRYLALTYPENSKAMLANLNYHIGIILYNKGYVLQAEKYLKGASSINPEMSFLFVELSNLYFSENKPEDGVATLNYCLKFSPAADDCNKYLISYQNSKTIYTPGFLSKIIDEYHGQKLQ